MSRKLLVKGGTVLTMDNKRRVIPDGAIAIEDGRILRVGPTDTVSGGFAPDEVVDAKGCLVMPGLI